MSVIGVSRSPVPGLGCSAQTLADHRGTCRKRCIIPMIPHRSNAKNRPQLLPKLLYKTLARIDRYTCREAPRKTAESYAALSASRAALSCQIHPQSLGKF